MIKLNALTHAIAAGLIVIAKEKWLIEAVAYRHEGFLYVKLNCELPTPEGHLNAVIDNRSIKLWLDDKKIGHPYCGTSLSFTGWFAGPDERLARHLLRMCRPEISAEIRRFRIQEKMPNKHDLEMQQRALKQQQALAAMASTK